MYNNLPFVDRKPKSFSNPKLTPHRQKVISIINNLKSSIAASSTLISIKKQPSACRCSLSQALSIQQLSKMTPRHSSFISLIDQIQSNNYHDFLQPHHLNTPSRQSLYRQGVYYRRSSISKSVKLSPAHDYQSLQAYKNSTPQSLLDIQQPLTNNSYFPITAKSKTFDLRTPQLSKRLRKNNNKIRFIKTSTSTFK